MCLMSLSVGICKNDLDLDSFFKRSNPFHPSLTVNNTKLNSNTKFFKTKKFNVWIPQSIFFPTSIRSIRWLFQVFEEQREAVFVLLGTFRHQRKKNWKKKNKLVRSAAKPNNVKLQPSRSCWLDRLKHHWLFIQLKTLAGVLSWPTIRIFQNILHTYLRPTFKSPNHRLGSKKKLSIFGSKKKILPLESSINWKSIFAPGEMVMSRKMILGHSGLKSEKSAI